MNELNGATSPAKSKPRRPGKLNYLPLLAGPLSVVLVKLAQFTYPRFNTYFSADLEVIAPYLIGAVVAIYVIRSIVTLNPLYIITVFLAFSLLLREIHYDFMGKGIFVCFAIIVAWSVLWRKQLVKPIQNDWRHTSWLVATIAIYFLSQVVAKRVFRFIPGEQSLHTQFEEGIETMAHLMFIVTALLGSWRRYRIWTQLR